MVDSSIAIKYPRNRFWRGLLRSIGRLVLPLAFEVKVTGEKNFPRQGPLLVVGNHDAIMEVAMMAVYTPWQIEVMGAGDLPHDRLTQFFARFFGFIPVRRGSVDRPALKNGLSVLRQGGILGIFPEGGLWQSVTRRAQSGVAWLSYRAKAPVLPIGYGNTIGSLDAALKGKRPPLTMHVGELIPPADITRGQARKDAFEAYAERVMQSVHALIPVEERPKRPKIVAESYELEFAVRNLQDLPLSIPAEISLKHGAEIARLFHQPVLMKTFRENLNLPIEPLQNLESHHDAHAIRNSSQAILDYLARENPYFLTYRYGPKIGEAMRDGLVEIINLASWAASQGANLKIIPVRRYRVEGKEEEIVQTEQGSFRDWM